AIHSSLDAWQKLFAGRAEENYDIAVVFNPEELLLHGFPEASSLRASTSMHWGDKALHALLKSGYAFRPLSLQDFLAEKKTYKVTIFLNAWTLNQEIREELQVRQRQQGIFTIWCHAPGLVTEEGFNPTAMKMLTGLELAVDDSTLPFQAQLNDGTELACRYRGKVVTEAPRIYCNDREAEVLATYTDNQQIALAFKRLPEGAKVIWSGLPIHRPDLWRKLFQRAGLQAQTEAGITFYSDSSVSVLHTAKAGSWNLSISGPLVDLFGSDIQSRADETTISSKGPQTWLLWKEKK
ncbi:MAG: hypothetical protein WCT05_12510, partial [Lentisphaeria bacterium]